MNSWRSTGQHKISGFGLWISSTPQNQRKKIPRIRRRETANLRISTPHSVTPALQRKDVWKHQIQRKNFSPDPGGGLIMDPPDPEISRSCPPSSAPTSTACRARTPMS